MSESGFELVCSPKRFLGALFEIKEAPCCSFFRGVALTAGNAIVLGRPEVGSDQNVRGGMADEGVGRQSPE